MFRLSKRRFVQLAGLSIANRILPGWAWAQRPDTQRRGGEAARRKSNKVIIVTFGGGVRYAETFAPDGQRNIPRLAGMKPQGAFFRTCINSGVLSHFNSTASILTGNWQRVDDFGFQPPAGATLFEQFRKQTGAGPLDAWVVATNKSFASMGSSSDRALGAPYGANVVLPKQLLLEAVQEVVKKGVEGGVASRENVLARLEGVLSECYEGVGWTIFQSGNKLDRHVRETLLHGLLEYINGPEVCGVGRAMFYHANHARIRRADAGISGIWTWHWGSYSLYLNAITRTDHRTGMLWDEIEQSNYRRNHKLVLPSWARWRQHGWNDFSTTAVAKACAATCGCYEDRRPA